jgi:hypothetical protein
MTIVEHAKRFRQKLTPYLDKYHGDALESMVFESIWIAVQDVGEMCAKICEEPIGTMRNWPDSDAQADSQLSEAADKIRSITNSSKAL